MRATTPSVHLIARPQVVVSAIASYLHDVGGEAWVERAVDVKTLGHDAELLIEFAGRMCYRSWEPGLNPNVTRVRTDRGEYLRNILASGHGSVLEHANYTFVLQDVSRVLTQELERHRAGTAVSQESMRYVRLEEIPFEHPAFVYEDSELLGEAQRLVAQMENFQLLASEIMGLDEPETDFHTKKEITSAMRRYAPEGVATSLVWTANVRALRHIVALRTAPGAEEEIRRVFAMVGKICRRELPNLFDDFVVTEDGSWVPQHPKV